MMPAYSFQARFVVPIRAGTKGGTIRAPRRMSARGIYATQRIEQVGGHAYPREQLSLYCRQRCRDGFKIADKACIASEPIALDFAGEKIAFPRSGHVVVGSRVDIFARFDGFDTFEEMSAFWQQTHQTDAFRGWHIRWAPLPKLIAP